MKKKKKKEGEWGINKGKVTVIEMKLAARNYEKKDGKINNEKQRGKVSATQESRSHPEKDE